MTNITPQDFEYYQRMLQEKSGLSLSADKSYLLETRLTPIASSLGYESLGSFTQDLRSTSNPALIRNVVEAMTTNETSFFRDTKPFSNLIELLPEIMQAKKDRKQIRIWSAACSSGQECYSIAMALNDYFADKPGWTIQILGTDISQEMLTQARRGEYSQFEIQRGLSIQTMLKYFTQEGSVWRIKENMRNMVQFQYANLLENFAHTGAFDIVFCRNVLIYFNNETKTKALNNIAQRMSGDSLLFLGACETAINLPVPFENVAGKHGILRLKQATEHSQRAQM